MYEITFTPVVTEKSTLDSAEGKYHFFVPGSANKIEVKKQLEVMYGKKVDKVHVINTKGKTRLVGRGRLMTKRRPMKKIIVTFKGGETIDLNKIK